MNAVGWPLLLLLLTFHRIVVLSLKKAYVVNNNTTLARLGSVSKPGKCYKAGLGHNGGTCHKAGLCHKDGNKDAIKASGDNACCYNETVTRNKVILLCGGISERMNGELKSLVNSNSREYYLPPDSPPYKQFIFMHGVPLFVYSFAEFLNLPFVSEITIVAKPEWQAKVIEYVDTYAGKLLQRLNKTSEANKPPTGTRDHKSYENHHRKYPFFIYDLEEQRCVLSDSSSWNQALDSVLGHRNSARYKLIKLCVSGTSRAESVFNALRGKNTLGVKLPGCCREEYIALVHDAVRPLIRHLDIEALISAARKDGAAIPAVRVADTIKVGTQTDGLTVVKSTLDRPSLFAIQTPQAFRSSVLIRAYMKGLDANEKNIPSWLTDDASFVENLGETKVVIVPGHKMNTKVTVWEDIQSCSQGLKKEFFPEN